jgi:hypothetical protein
MFTNPYIPSELIRDRQRERLARASQQRLAHQIRERARTSRCAPRTQRRLRHALRTALQLRAQADG